MTKSCIVCGCKDNARPAGVSFHGLPVRDPQLCKQWLSAINSPLYPPNTPTTGYKNILICSQHFRLDDFEGHLADTLMGTALTSRRKLKAGAVPSIFPAPAPPASTVSVAPAPATASVAPAPPASTVSVAVTFHGPSSDVAHQRKRQVVEQPLTSTPSKVPRTQGASGCGRNPAVLPEEEMDSSFTSMESLDVRQDTTQESSFRPDFTSGSSPPSTSDSGGDSGEETREMHWQEPKVIVSESKVLELMKFCQTCLKVIKKKEVSYMGSQMRVKWECETGHTGTWTSCISERGMPQSNLLIAAALLFTGNTYTKLEEWAKLINLHIFGSSTFYAMQNSYLHPVIQAEYDRQREALLAKMFLEQEDGLQPQLCSDGRSDSPGFNAKYTTYTFMADPSKEIVHSELVQVTETTSSVAMESLGFRRGINTLLDTGLNVEVLATDRSTSIKKIMREEYPSIQHEFDIWHTSKSIQKKLITKAKKRGRAALKPWIRSVRNHLWFSCDKAGGDVGKLKSTWNSIIHHTVDEHTWTEGGTEHHCLHPPITTEDREKKKWLCKESEEYHELAAVVNDKNLQKDLDHMGRFKHTGPLEVFHGALLKYAPKRQHFSNMSMKQRTHLAIMEHNENLTCKQKVDCNGKPVIDQVWSKRSKEWVTKKRYEPHTTNFRTTLMELVWKRRQDESVIFKDESSRLPRPDLPANIAAAPKPTKEDAAQTYKTRF